MKKVIKIYALGFLYTILVSLVIAMHVQANGLDDPMDVPDEVIEISEELGSEYNICPELIQAICYVESRFQADAENGECIGIMQVSHRWHKDRMERLEVTDLTDMSQNMTVAVDYLAELAKDGEDLEVPLMRYHGETDIMERLESGETSWYVKKVLEISALLEEQHGK